MTKKNPPPPITNDRNDKFHETIPCTDKNTIPTALYPAVPPGGTSTLKGRPGVKITYTSVRLSGFRRSHTADVRSEVRHENSTKGRGGGVWEMHAKVYDGVTSIR